MDICSQKKAQMLSDQQYNTILRISKDLRKISEAKAEQMMDDWRQKKFATNSEAEGKAYNKVLRFEMFYGSVSVRHHHMALNYDKTLHTTVNFTMDNEEELVVYGHGVYLPTNFRFDFEEWHIRADAKAEDIYDALVEGIETRYVDLTEEFARYEERVERNRNAKKQKVAK